MKKNSAGINGEIGKLSMGGTVYLPVGTYDIHESVLIDTPCIKLEGEVWNYSADPNGVFESEYGTKLRMQRNDIPAVYVGRDQVLGGIIIKDIGIQGNIKGMDTRGLFDSQNPSASAGVCLDSRRVDQAEFSKLSFCGVASAICAINKARIDGCLFEKLNTDGCCVGIYFAPEASYYTTFRACIVADTPAYGFFAQGENAIIFNTRICNSHFVRNGGAFLDNHPWPKAVVCLYHVSESIVNDNIFDYPGVFWYYPEDATDNRQKTVLKHPIPAIWVEGDKNRIIGNIFTHSSEKTMVVKGSGNIIMNNIIDSDIYIEGEHNIVANNIFSNSEAKIILGKGSENTELINVPEERIVRI